MSEIPPSPEDKDDAEEVRSSLFAFSSFSYRFLFCFLFHQLITPKRKKSKISDEPLVSFLSASFCRCPSV
jgi:hypothetical protein